MPSRNDLMLEDDDFLSTIPGVAQPAATGTVPTADELIADLTRKKARAAAEQAAAAATETAPASRARATEGARERRVSIAWPLETFKEARVAFSQDDQDGVRDVDSFRLWLSEVITEHALRPQAERLALAQALPALPAGKREPRSVMVTEASVEAMMQALDDDLEFRGNKQRSAFVLEAVRVAVEFTRKRVGKLPPFKQLTPGPRARKSA